MLWHILFLIINKIINLYNVPTVHLLRKYGLIKYEEPQIKVPVYPTDPNYKPVNALVVVPERPNLNPFETYVKPPPYKPFNNIDISDDIKNIIINYVNDRKNELKSSIRNKKDNILLYIKKGLNNLKGIIYRYISGVSHKVKDNVNLYFYSTEKQIETYIHKQSNIIDTQVKEHRKKIKNELEEIIMNKNLTNKPFKLPQIQHNTIKHINKENKNK